MESSDRNDGHGAVCRSWNMINFLILFFDSVLSLCTFPYFFNTVLKREHCMPAMDLDHHTRKESLFLIFQGFICFNFPRLHIKFSQGEKNELKHFLPDFNTWMLEIFNRKSLSYNQLAHYCMREHSNFFTSFLLNVFRILFFVIYLFFLNYLSEQKKKK